MNGDPDFIHIINNNRFRKNESNISSQKTSIRAYMNDNITLRFEDGSQSTVPRFRLDKEFIQSAVNRMTAKKAASKPKEVFKSHLFSKDTAKKQSSRPPAMIFSHLHHRESNTIIMSDDTELKTKCSANFTYDVVAMPAIAINDGGVLSLGVSRSSRCLPMESTASYHTETHYDGDVLFIVHDVPLSTQNGAYEVTEIDVKIWIVSGAIASLQEIDVLTKKIKSLKEKLMQIQQELASLPPVSMSGGKGRVSIGSSTNNIRDKKAKVLQIEKERCSSLLQTAMNSLETLYSQHMEDCKLSVEKRTRDGTLFDNKCCDWAILVDGNKKAMYTSLIEKNKNWSIVPMYAFGTKGSKAPSSLPIPEEDQSHHFVDIRGVTITKLPHGFGIFESYEEFDRGNSRSRHRLYHGQFHEGEFSEGSLYTEAGIFSGKFDKGYPIEGTMQYADGVEISGKFAVEDVQDGFQVIRFPDKATYEGEMKQGRITGKGTYKDAGLELSGEFKDRVLQVDGGEEGHGYSNLHLSLMYGGERLWGPTSIRHTTQRKK